MNAFLILYTFAALLVGWSLCLAAHRAPPAPPDAPDAHDWWLR